MTKQPDQRVASQRKNFEKALLALDRSISQPVQEPRDLSGIIKDFEIAYELSWKVLKTFLENQGHETSSARDAFSKAYQLKYLKDQDVWLEMIGDRNLVVHTYDESLAKSMCDRIREKYASAFRAIADVIS